MFAYCLNNPTFYSDGTGNYTAVNNRNFLNYDPLPLACGGGAIAPFVIPSIIDWFCDTLDNVADAWKNWINGQRKAVENKVAKSLAKSKTYHSPDSYHDHHIVTKSDLRGLPAQKVLEEIFQDYGVEDPRNHMLVSSRIHVRLHSDLYYFLVNNTITLCYHAAGNDPMQREEFVTAGLISLRVFIKSLELL